jgi:hypothetical protein
VGSGIQSARVLDQFGQQIDAMVGPLEQILDWAAQNWPGAPIDIVPIRDQDPL